MNRLKIENPAALVAEDALNSFTSKLRALAADNEGVAVYDVVERLHLVKFKGGRHDVCPAFFYSDQGNKWRLDGLSYNNSTYDLACLK